MSLGIDYWSNKINQNGSDFKGKLVFALIGFLAGVTVAYSGFSYRFQIANPNPVLKTLPAESLLTRTLRPHDHRSTCSCDATPNSSTVQCSPCMDEYYAIDAQFKQCHREQTDLERERDALRVQLTGNAQECTSSLAALRDECATKREALQREVATHHYDDAECTSSKAQVRRLEHELGECNVEWGACQQVGRQHNKLDEKRIEEIEKQKTRFTLCNDQLKRIKADAKEQNAK